MFVLRVETFTGKGCYSVGAMSYVHEDLDFPESLWGEHPLAQEDEGLREAWSTIQSQLHRHIKQWRFAFASPLQYFAWFYSTQARRRLAEADMLLRVYEVPDECVAVGTSQSLFEVTKARRHMTLRPDIDPGTLMTIWNAQALAKAA